MAFLSKYRKLRGIQDIGMREVEFNFGRMFHQLGILDSPNFTNRALKKVP